MDRELGSSRLVMLEAEFEEYVSRGIATLKRVGYNPIRFLEMVGECGGALGATKRLLSNSRHTSYGFERLWGLGRLDATVEYAACLPWFEELFAPQEIYEASTRLITHDFPLPSRIAAETAPAWLSELPG
ncbi:hypothetical protein ACFIN9_18785 [Streptomyces noursei]|uniref:hypothetical protein n=1 Tax=Streptomyces noursei TaxID=1971 RepID=UPI0036D40329